MINLHEQSERFLSEVFGRYTLSEKYPDTLVGKFVIHLYAESDTCLDDGKLAGFYDSLFFRADIYDIENLCKYSVSGRDGISIINHPVNVRIFKDGSTVIFSPTKFEIYLGQELYIRSCTS